MADENTQANAGAATGGEPANEPTVRVDGRDVPISQAPQVLKDMETSIKSGYDRKLDTERSEIKRLLEEDKRWYAEHPDPRVWSLYEPKVDGGRGFIGKEEDLRTMASDDDYGEHREQHENAFKTDPKIASLEAKIAELEKRNQQVYEGVSQSELNRVRHTRDELLKKYPNANAKMVNLMLDNVYRNTGSHAYEQTIEKIVKESHDEITKAIASQSAGKEERGKPGKSKTATPDATDSPPVEDDDTKEKPVSIESDALSERIRSKLGL